MAWGMGIRADSAVCKTACHLGMERWKQRKSAEDRDVSERTM